MKTRFVALFGSLAAAAAIATVAAAAPIPSASDNLVGGEYLFPGQGLVAAGCFYHLEMQGDGNLVTYGGGSSSAIWSAGTQNRGGYAVLQGNDGNFVIRNWNDQAVWFTGVTGHPNAFIRQQLDSNLVEYDDHTFLWSSGRVNETLGQQPCFRRARKTQVSNNTDRLGGDYKDIVNSARASHCGRSCALESSTCKSWTWVPPGVKPDGKAHCYLKNTIPSATARSGLVSGRIIDLQGG
jgi:hypothetical protein